jgi:hypothetical protein
VFRAAYTAPAGAATRPSSAGVDHHQARDEQEDHAGPNQGQDHQDHQADVFQHVHSLSSEPSAGRWFTLGRPRPESAGLRQGADEGDHEYDADDGDDWPCRVAAQRRRPQGHGEEQAQRDQQGRKDQGRRDKHRVAPDLGVPTGFAGVAAGGLASDEPACLPHDLTGQDAGDRQPERGHCLLGSRDPQRGVGVGVVALVADLDEGVVSQQEAVGRQRQERGRVDLWVLKTSSAGRIDAKWPGRRLLGAWKQTCRCS